MRLKVAEVMKNALKRDAVASTVSSYERIFDGSQAGGTERRKAEYKRFTNKYHDLVTAFYEYGWGKSFHFAPRAPNESFAASLIRHELYLAHRLAPRPGMRVADLGCGVGGPLCEIARFSGATVVGVNNSLYQIDRAGKLTEAAGLSHLAEFLVCDFMNMDAPDNSFDAAYGVEATGHAPSKVSWYGEVFRVLKPGGFFAAYEYARTPRLDPKNPLHLRIKTDLETGGALQDSADPGQFDDALRQVGFELLEFRNLAENPGPGLPW